MGGPNAAGKPNEERGRSIDRTRLQVVQMSQPRMEPLSSRFSNFDRERETLATDTSRWRLLLAEYGHRDCGSREGGLEAPLNSKAGA